MQKVVGSSPISRLREAALLERLRVSDACYYVSAETLASRRVRLVEFRGGPGAAADRHRASACPASFTPVSANPDRQRQQRSFSKLEDVKREDSKRRFRETTAGERIENALRLSALTTELRSGLRPRQ
jgi:hypothetical protein